MRILLFISLFIILIPSSCREEMHKTVPAGTPEIFPDYRNVTVPFNIAPLNFRIPEEFDRTVVILEGRNTGIEIKSRNNEILIPAWQWKNLLEANSGSEITVIIKARKGSEWYGFDKFVIKVSEVPADEYIVYREIMPGYQNWNRMGIYQRRISSFDVKTVIDSRVLPGTCMNCHSFAKNEPENMVLHLRESFGGTLLYRKGNLEKLNTRTGKMFANAAFPSWHPSGKYIAFSVNRVNQIFHAAGNFRAAAVDMKSDVFVYDIEKNSMITSDALSSGNKFESFPCFSPDGTRLYYCSADSLQLPQKYNKIKYSLCSVGFDPSAGTLTGTADTIISAAASGKSVSLPRVSPDGRFIMFVMADYGCFPAYNPESDFWLLDLESGIYQPMESINSSSVESWHTWSSEGRWVAFSSRRKDGLFSDIWLSFIDTDGNGSKPFILPQRSPSFYDKTLYSFNVPEFIRSEVVPGTYDIEKIARTGPAVQVQNQSGH